MRIPQKPPALNDIMTEIQPPQRLFELITAVREQGALRRYLHWDKLRRLPAPKNMNHREWWLAVKLARQDALRSIMLQDEGHQFFAYAVPEEVMAQLHQIDLGAGGLVAMPEPITNPNTRDRYLVSSLMEEAITSSQLEGAVTTRDEARDMIRTGRQPRDYSEQMILNNYRTMQRIREWKAEPLSPELVFRIHRLVTEKTLDDPTAAGRFRRANERKVVGDDYGEVYHTPPPAEQLPERLAAMCAFANGDSPDHFVHPVVRAILLHFWLAYDHPFVDGNGRTARALFYWALLHNGYWLFEFISISSILRKAPIRYARSFLYTETDDNDLTYFLLAQTEVITRAINELHAYIERKTRELREAESQLRALAWFNHRQVALIRHGLKHPGQHYSIESHRNSHDVVYQTARTDLLALANYGVLDQYKRGKQLIFIAPQNMAERLAKLESQPPFQSKHL